MNTFTLLRNKLRQNQAKARLKYAFDSAKIYNSRKSGQKEFRSYPKVHAVTFMEDRTTFVFTLPNGYDPKELAKKEFVFKQIFGSNTELKGDYKKFVLTIYETSMPNALAYDWLTIRPVISPFKLGIICGQDRNGQWLAFDLTKNPHMLIAGETGSGKSSILRVILTSLILSHAPKRLHLYLADCKRSEFHIFRNVEHVKAIVSKPKQIHDMLEHVRKEMDARSDLMEAFGVAHVDDLPADQQRPYLVVCIDEVGLLRDEKEIQEIMKDIVFIGRALGVFLVLSLQRPTHDCLNTTIRAELTVKMGFKVSGKKEATYMELPGCDEIETPGRYYMRRNGKVTEVQAPELKVEPAKVLLDPFKVAPRNAKDITPAPPGTPQIPEDTGAITLDDLFNQHEGDDEE